MKIYYRLSANRFLVKYERIKKNPHPTHSHYANIQHNNSKVRYFAVVRFSCHVARGSIHSIGNRHTRKRRRGVPHPSHHIRLRQNTQNDYLLIIMCCEQNYKYNILYLPILCLCRLWSKLFVLLRFFFCPRWLFYTPFSGTYINT